jgi:hypothetical protein
MRQSGDTCTALGNTFANYIVLHFLLHGGNPNGSTSLLDSILVEGDDGLVVSSTPLHVGDFNRLGLIVKLLVCRDVSDTQFCKITLADDGSLLRDPVEFFTKFGWTSTAPLGRAQTKLRLLKSKCLSAIADAPGCPISSVFCARLLRRVIPQYLRPYNLLDQYHVHDQFVTELISGDTEWSDSVVEQFFLKYDRKPTTVARELYEHKFGISVREQLAIEESILQDDFSFLSNFEPSVDMQDYCLKYIERY